MFNYAVLFLTSILDGVHGNEPCLGAPTIGHSFVASPVSCSAYIICMDGRTIRGESCREGLLFEPRAQICGSSTCMECSPFGIQNLPHPLSCHQFIECTMGHRTFRTCPDGMLFDRRIGNCNFQEFVVCEDDPSITTTTEVALPVEPSCYKGELFHPHRYDCTRFYICVNYELWEQQCPKNFHWSTHTNSCTHPELAGCANVGEKETGIE